MEDRRTILFVDDDESMLSAVKRELMDEPYHLLWARGGKEALEVLEKNEVTVIVTDMLMPEMSGLDLLKTVKEKYPEAIRMIMSGHANITTLLNAINENIIYKFITKPWPDSETLKSIVQQAVEYYNLHRERDTLLAQVERLRQEVPVQ